MKKSSLIRIDHLLQRCWTIYTNKYKHFLVIPIIMMAIFAAVGYLISFFISRTSQALTENETIFTAIINPRGATVYVIFLAIIIAVIVQAVGIIALIFSATKNNAKLSIGDSIRQAFDNFWKFIGISALVILINIIVTILAYIPAILLGIIVYFIYPSQFSIIFTALSIIPALASLIYVFWFIFAYFEMINNKGVVKALINSKQLIKGRWWKVFWRILIMYIIVLLVGLIFRFIPYFGTIITFLVFIPLNIIYMFVLHEDLKIQTNTKV